MGFYVRCDDNCLHEAMTKEETLNALAQLARGVFVDEDTDYEYELYVANGRLMMRRFEGETPGFEFDETIISKVKERNAGGYITFWVGTQAQYNALTNKDPNCHYHITDSTRDADIDTALQRALADAEAAKQISQEANNAAQSAVSTAANALTVANGLCMKVEFEATPNTDNFQHTGAKSQIYVVTVERSEGEYFTVTTDFWTVAHGYGCYRIGDSEYYLNIDLSGKTVTFTTMAHMKIVAVRGYY